MIRIASFLTALVSMLALDAVWLTAMAGRFYQPRIGHLMAGAFSLPPAVVFYLLYALGLCVFVLPVWIARITTLLS